MDKDFIKIEKSVKNWFDKNNLITDRSKIRLSEPVFDSDEVTEVLKVLMLSNGWIAQGPVVEKFEKEFARYIGVKEAIAVNSGSSANLIAIASLIQNGLVGPGDEVIVPAATFPTVVTPIIQMGLAPVFVDVGADANIDAYEIKKAITPKTKIIMVVHTLGKPADILGIKRVVGKRKILIFEDSCEAHGAMIGRKKTGSMGVAGTFSFYVAHNMTTGEGGMIVTDNSKLALIMRSLREFGRYKGKNASARFSVKDPVLGNYDTRQLFSKIGYNLRMSDIEGALGRVQLTKLDRMNQLRRKTAAYYSSKLKKFEKYFILPTESENNKNVYYGYLLIIRPGLGVKRSDLVNFLEFKGIETRPLFGGCLPDQPAFRNIKSKIIGDLPMSRLIRDNALFVGCHPGITPADSKKVADSISEFIDGKENSRQ